MIRRPSLLLGLAALGLYAVTPPAVVNGDGLGYLRPFVGGRPAPVPGHLLYVPLLGLLERLAPGHLLEAARLANALLGALAVVFTHAAIRRVLRRAAPERAGAADGAAWVGAAGLAVSYGVWVQAVDVETYAAALCGVAASFLALAAWSDRPTLGRALAAGALAAASALFHVTSLLFFACVAAWLLWAPAADRPPRRRRLGHLAAAGALGAATVAAAYAWVALRVLDLAPAAAWTWFRGATHGFVTSLRPYSLTDAVNGLAKSLVFAPYVSEADVSTVLGQYLLGLLAVGALTGLVAWRWRALPALPGRPLLAWVVPYALMAILFFGSDSERWIFVLPAGWLLVAAALATLPAPRARRVGRTAVAALALVNLATAIVPAAADITPRYKASAVEAVVDDGDLVVFPGHDWDEYIGFYDRRGVRVWPLAYFVGLHGVDGALGRLEDAIRWTRNRGGQVYVVRVLDDQPGIRGWEELALLGLPRQAAEAYFRRYDLTPLDPVRGVTIHRVEDTARAPARARRR